MKLNNYLYLLVPVLLIIIVVSGLQGAFAPLLSAFIAAYLLFPVIKKLEKFNIRREVSTVAVFMAFILLLAGFVALTLPKLISDTESFIKEVPKITMTTIEKVESIANNYGYEIDINKKNLVVFAKKYSSKLSIETLKSVTSFISKMFKGFNDFLLGIMNLFLFPIFFLYVIMDYEKIAKNIKSVIPPKHEKNILALFSSANGILAAFFRGQILVASFLALTYSIGLGVIGVKFGVLIGFCAGILSLIPYVGFSMGLATALLLGLVNFAGWGSIVAIIVLFLVVQMIEGFIITPKVVGDKVGINALATMLALIIGGNLAGLAGMLVAIPAAGIINMLVLEFLKSYKKSSIYL